ncbi:hypothetical protein FBU30_001922 [Linnemannia zychae]|nr:hypothetical protein FBU30_001922 [Linnemannia zychae]
MRFSLVVLAIVALAAAVQAAPIEAEHSAETPNPEAYAGRRCYRISKDEQNSDINKTEGLKKQPHPSFPYLSKKSTPNCLSTLLTMRLDCIQAVSVRNRNKTKTINYFKFIPSTPSYHSLKMHFTLLIIAAAALIAVHAAPISTEAEADAGTFEPVANLFPCKKIAGEWVCSPWGYDPRAQNCKTLHTNK